MYVRCNVTRVLWKSKANTGIATLCFEAFKEEHERREGGVVFIHDKGHSNDPGNDKADDRVQWGKADGPYCRFALDGNFEGDYIDQPRPEPQALPTGESPHHPSPSKQFNPLQSFESNLSLIDTAKNQTPRPLYRLRLTRARNI